MHDPAVDAKGIVVNTLNEAQAYPHRYLNRWGGYAGSGSGTPTLYAYPLVALFV